MCVEKGTKRNIKNAQKGTNLKIYKFHFSVILADLYSPPKTPNENETIEIIGDETINSIRNHPNSITNSPKACENEICFQSNIKEKPYCHRPSVNEQKSKRLLSKIKSSTDKEDYICKNDNLQNWIRHSA